MEIKGKYCTNEGDVYTNKRRNNNKVLRARPTKTVKVLVNIQKNLFNVDFNSTPQLEIAD